MTRQASTVNRHLYAWLFVGPLLAVAAQLADVTVSGAFDSPVFGVGTLTYFILGSAVGVLIQGVLAGAMDRRAGRPPLPLSNREVTVIGVLDFLSVVPWLYALIHGNTGVVLALGSLAPVLVGGWEMYAGKLKMNQGAPGLVLVVAGAVLLLVGAAEAGTNPLPDLCIPALVVRTLASASVEIWERKVPNLASYRFVGLRFVIMTSLGIPAAILALAFMGNLDAATSMAADISLGIVLAHVVSQVFWFAVKVARVQVKQHLDSVTLPAVAFSTYSSLGALTTAFLNVLVPGSFPKASFSMSLLFGAVTIVSGAAALAAARAIAKRKAALAPELQPVPGKGGTP